MRKFFILAFIFTFCFQSNANQNKYDISSFEIKRGSAAKSNGICYIPKLTDLQKYIIDDIRRVHLRESSLIKNDVKQKINTYSKILLNKNILNSWRADEAADKLYFSRRNLLKQQIVFFHAVYYQVLNSEQRKYLISCL